MNIRPKIINEYVIRQGVIAGLLMVFILIMFQLAGNDYSQMAKLIKHMALGGVITVSLLKIISNQKGKVFLKGIIIGNKITITAAVLLMLFNIIIYLLTPEYAFSKYNLVPTSIFQTFVISVILFFETFVFGNIITFVSMQYFKNQPRS